MHVCTYTHPYIHTYFTAYGPPKHQRSVRTNPHPLIKRVIRRRAKVGNKCIACGPLKQLCAL